MLVAKDQQGRGDPWSGSGIVAGPRRTAIIGIPITLGFFLTEHPLLFQTPLVHFIGEGVVAFVVLVVGRARIPPVPEPWIVIASTPGIAVSKATSASETPTVVAESVVTEAAMESIVHEGTASEGAMR